MESNDEVRAQIHEADRASAAPYLNSPATAWWVIPPAGVLASLFVLSVNLRTQTEVPGWIATLPLALFAACALGYIRWHRRRVGTMPAGKASRELTRVMWGFTIGAVLVAVALFALADLTPLWVGVPAAFALASAGIAWFGYAYNRAATRTRNRLA